MASIARATPSPPTIRNGRCEARPSRNATPSGRSVERDQAPLVVGGRPFRRPFAGPQFARLGVRPAQDRLGSLVEVHERSFVIHHEHRRREPGRQVASQDQDRGSAARGLPPWADGMVATQEEQTGEAYDRRRMTSPGIPRTKAVLFDIDGTLIDTGGAGARSWSWAFERLHGVPADIATSSSAGMTDPDVARRTFEAVLGRAPSDHELARLFAWYVYQLQHEVEISDGYRVLAGVVETLSRLMDRGVVLGIVSGGLEGSARIKLERGHLNRYFPAWCLRHRLTRSTRDHSGGDRSRLHDARPGHRVERRDRRRRYAARRRRRGSGGRDLARGRQWQLLRGRAPTIGCRLRTRVTRGAFPTFDGSAVSHDGRAPKLPSSMLRACTTRSGISAEVLDNLGVFRSMPRRNLVAALPVGLSPGADLHRLGLLPLPPGFRAAPARVAHTHPDSEEWITSWAIGKGASEELPVAAPRHRDRAGSATRTGS